MKKEFVSYEIALALKKLGFDEECLGCYPLFNKFLLTKHPYSNSKHQDETPLAAPLWQQAIDWFRDEKGLVINVYANASGYLFEFHDNAKLGGTHRYDSGFDGPNEGGCWNEYPDARKAAILKAIELCQQK